MTIRVLLLLLLATITLAGCLSDEPTAGSGSSDSATGRGEILVTRDSQSAQPRCRPYSVARRLLRFSTALNSEDLGPLRSIWGSGFEFFSITQFPAGADKDHFVAYEAGEALRHVRKKGGFSLSLTEIAITDYRGSRGAEITYDGTWKVSDGHRGGKLQVLGKGFISCTTPVIESWAMSVRQRGLKVDVAFCPAPRTESTSPVAERTRGVVVVCAPPSQG